MKNELSMHFLRGRDNLVATVKTAIRVHTAVDHKARYLDEQIELKKIQKLIDKTERWKQRKYLDKESEEEKK